MSGTGTRLSLNEARQIARDFIAAHIRGRCEVVGSIRRGKMEVGDIELLIHADARLERIDAEGAGDAMFGAPQATYRWIKNGKKYHQLEHVARGYKIDIFRADDRNWGSQMIIRTGPAEFSTRFVVALRQRGNPHGDTETGYVNDSSGAIVPCPDEETAFRLAGWNVIDPGERNG